MLAHSQNATIRAMFANMIKRILAVATLLAAATPAFAIQEVVLGARAPSFAAAPIAGLGWQDLPMPGSPLSFSTSSAVRDPRQWAFTSGETLKMGSFLFNTTSGPNWALGSPMGFNSAFAPSIVGSRGINDLGFTTRTTAGYMASDTLMFYASVGQTSYRTGPSIIPTAPGLALIETPSGRNDMRAGFKVELMPGLTFGAEAAFSQPTR
jgi:hypothetical protein